ncbi:permease-like cell division protein FtsX [Sphaerisporangium sp. NPDC049003]|uniref:permease-like cell division protein FtsX n=1 Tax=Sphaerisporangium sp. NPDC049003 TaxID=3364517 RepID=UPI00372266E6
MDAPASSHSAEELSFGGDPDRDPWLRAWISAHRRLLAVCTAVLVVLGLAGGGGWYLYDRSRRPLPPPDGPWPEHLGFTVGLCGKWSPSPACTPAAELAAKKPSGIEAALRAVPEIATIRFSEERFVSRGDPNKSLWVSRVISGMGDASDQTSYVSPANFVGTVRTRDYARVAARVRSIEGVSYVWSQAMFWEGKADVAIDLCAKGPGLVCGGIDDRSVTEPQKRAIVDRLWDIPGVEKIYFEDHAHVRKIREHYASGDADASDDPAIVSADDMRESLYVKLTDRRAVEVVGESIKDMPGVRVVRRVGAE